MILLVRGADVVCRVKITCTHSSFIVKVVEKKNYLLRPCHWLLSQSDDINHSSFAHFFTYLIQGCLKCLVY